MQELRIAAGRARSPGTVDYMPLDLSSLRYGTLLFAYFKQMLPARFRVTKPPGKSPMSSELLSPSIEVSLAHGFIMSPNAHLTSKLYSCNSNLPATGLSSIL